MRTFFLSVLLLVLTFASSAQLPIDVLHYRFSLDLNDENDTIRGKAEITVKFLAETPGDEKLDRGLISYIVHAGDPMLCTIGPIV